MSQNEWNLVDRLRTLPGVPPTRTGSWWLLWSPIRMTGPWWRSVRGRSLAETNRTTWQTDSTGVITSSLSRTTKTCKFSTNAQSRFALVVLDAAVPGPPWLARHTLWCPGSSVVLEATRKVSQGPLKVAVSAPKSPSRVRNQD